MSWGKFRSLIRLTLSGYTDNVVDSLSAGWGLAIARRHGSITPEHMLAGMVKVSQRRDRTFLTRLGLTFPPDEATELTGLVRPEKPSGRLGFDQATRDLLSNAREQARGRGIRYVGTEHLLLALLMGPDRPALAYLREHGIDAEALRETIHSLVGTVAIPGRPRAS